jgi:hypothetical protein
MVCVCVEISTIFGSREFDGIERVRLFVGK